MRRAFLVGALFLAAASYSPRAKAACAPGQLNASATCDCPPGYASVGMPGKARCQATSPTPDPGGKGGGTITVTNAKCKAGDLDGCKKQCDQKNYGSCVVLGRMYKTGEGVSVVDKEMGFSLFKKACDAGDQAGCVEQGRMYERGESVPKDVDKAVRLFGRACDAKFAEGCREVAGNYYFGEGVPKDVNKGVSFYEKACTYKDYSSCNRVGVLLYDGAPGITTDEEKATKLFEKACDGGEAIACTNLANAYEDGRGVPKDVKKTISLLDKSCTQGYAIGCNGLGLRYAKAQGVEKDWKQAYKYFEKACDGGQKNGCHNAGYCLENGEGVAKDEKTSAARYEKACNLGDQDSCYSLAEQYFDGRGVAKSDYKAAPLYKKACDDGKNAEACRGYGFLLWEGRGVSKDLILSVSYNKKGCEGEVGGACFNVGVAYELGGGVSKDLSSARTYYDKGCKLNNQSSCTKLTTLDKANEASVVSSGGGTLALGALGVTLTNLSGGTYKALVHDGSDGKVDFVKRDQNPQLGVLISKVAGQCSVKYSPKAGANVAKYSPSYLPGGWDTRVIETLKPDSDGDMLAMVCVDLPSNQLITAFFSYRGSLESSDFTSSARPFLTSLINAIKPGSASYSSPTSSSSSATPEPPAPTPPMHISDSRSSDDDDDEDRRYKISSFVLDVGGAFVTPKLQGMEESKAAAIGLSYTYSNRSRGSTYFAPVFKFSALGSVLSGYVYDTHIGGGFAIGLGPLSVSPMAGVGIDGASGSDKYFENKASGYYYYGADAGLTAGSVGLGAGLAFIKRSVAAVPNEVRYIGRLSFSKYIITGQLWKYEDVASGLKPEAAVITWGFRL